jgi:sulfite exporter TauE/SafE
MAMRKLAPYPVVVAVVGVTCAAAAAMDLGTIASYALLAAVVGPLGALSVALSEGVRLRTLHARRRR